MNAKEFFFYFVEGVIEQTNIYLETDKIIALESFREAVVKEHQRIKEEEAKKC